MYLDNGHRYNGAMRNSNENCSINNKTNFKTFNCQQSPKVAISHIQEEYCHDLKVVLGSNHNFIQNHCMHAFEHVLQRVIRSLNNARSF